MGVYGRVFMVGKPRVGLLGGVASLSPTMGVEIA